jgi:hypothetical protein
MHFDVVHVVLLIFQSIFSLNACSNTYIDLDHGQSVQDEFLKSMTEKQGWTTTPRHLSHGMSLWKMGYMLNSSGLALETCQAEVTNSPE